MKPVTCILCLFLTLALEAQHEVMKFDQLSAKNELSQNWVKAIHQDSRDFLWYGTNEGLSRSDGTHFKAYKQETCSPHSLIHNHVQLIYEDSHDRLWVGIRRGLNLYDRELDRFILLNATYGHSIEDMLELVDGRFLVATPSGLYLLDPSDRSFTGLFDGTFIHVIFRDDQNNIWLGTEDGLLLYNYPSNTYTHYLVSNSQEPETGPPGIQSDNNRFDSVWNQTGQALKITILPHWWQTTRAKGLLVMIVLPVLLVIYLIRKYTIISIKIKNEQRNTPQAYHMREDGTISTERMIGALDKAFMEKITSMIRDNYKNAEFNVNCMIREMAMSRSVFYKKYKAVSSTPINDLIKRYRLKKAEDLLLKTDMSVSEIAYTVGFNNQTYFSTLFKEQYNASPTAYKHSYLTCEGMCTDSDGHWEE